jgi:hypothetical protein
MMFYRYVCLHNLHILCKNVELIGTGTGTGTVPGIQYRIGTVEPHFKG